MSSEKDKVASSETDQAKAPASQKNKKKVAFPAEQSSEASQVTSHASTSSEPNQTTPLATGSSEPADQVAPQASQQKKKKGTAPAAADPETDQVTAAASDAAEAPSPDEHHKRRRYIKYCGCFTLAVAIFFLVMVFTVFKPKDLGITMNSITLQQLNNPQGSSYSVPQAINMNMSVKNPNGVSVSIGNSSVSLYYRDVLVGVAFGSLGTVRARKSFEIGGTVHVYVDQLQKVPNVDDDLKSGALVMTMSINMVGRIKILGIIKQNIDGVMNCILTVSTSENSIRDQNCR